MAQWVRLSAQTPLGARPGSGTQSRYEALADPEAGYVKTPRLTSDKWGSSLNNDPKLAVGKLRIYDGAFSRK